MGIAFIVLAFGVLNEQETMIDLFVGILFLFIGFFLLVVGAFLDEL